MRRAVVIFASQGLTPALYSTDRLIIGKIIMKDFKPKKIQAVLAKYSMNLQGTLSLF